MVIEMLCAMGVVDTGEIRGLSMGRQKNQTANAELGKGRGV
jgi:hypothetical protein